MRRLRGNAARAVEPRVDFTLIGCVASALVASAALTVIGRDPRGLQLFALRSLVLLA